MKLQGAQLEDLLLRLGAEPGMRRKVALLVGSWPLLRELSPQDRERVAMAVGSRWASRHLEGMFKHPDHLSENQRRVKAIFERMSDADGHELRRLGREIKQGGSSGAGSRLLGALEDALEEKLAAESGSEPAGVPPPPWLPAAMLEGVVEPDRPDRREETGAEGELGASEPRPPGVAKVEVAESDEPAEPKPAGVEEPGEATIVAPERDPAEAAHVAADTAASADTGTSAASGTSQDEAALEPMEPGEPAVEIVREDEMEAGSQEALEEPPADRRRWDAAKLSGVASLRVLRRLSRGETPSSHGERAALIAGLGSGWAARRAVSFMIRSQSAANLNEALDLIGRLPTATQQTWCLGDLIQHWELDESARERVLAAAPSPAAHRRLALRLPVSQ